MIGLIADASDHEVVREFFELFKTPWEFYQPDRRYDVVVSTDGSVDETAALNVLYSGRKLPFDDGVEIELSTTDLDTTFRFDDHRLPIYGDHVRFPDKSARHLLEEKSRQCVAHVSPLGEGCVARVGYDLFAEVRMLLTEGQPTANANIPALELHISFLRNLMMESGAAVVEIPPVPSGFQFIACLTHDVDHPSIRQHKWDHTAFGFLHRALFGSIKNCLCGRMSLRGLASNWLAALKLPFVYLGLANDFWLTFDDRYLEVEKGLPSTFFFIPFRDRAGQTRGGQAPMLRVARYRARDLESTIAKLRAAGCEIGLHGIDAWLDSSKGCEELNEIRQLTGQTDIGVRMHWLYNDSQTPLSLERAGARYDSTIGYNDTVGYRAGTTQVYRPLGATDLFELPLHAMDTALFYPAYLGLNRREATAVLDQIVENASQFGGCVTINWHDRSLGPERLWDTCYRDLIDNLKKRGAWFATARETVSWFHKRRSFLFRTDDNLAAVLARMEHNHRDSLPGLRLQIHDQRAVAETNGKRHLGIGVDRGSDVRHDNHDNVGDNQSL